MSGRVYPVDLPPVPAVTDLQRAFPVLSDLPAIPDLPAFDDLPEDFKAGTHLACTLSGLSAAVPYYGGGMTAGDEPARQPACPVMAHFGKQDHWIALDTVEAFKQAQPGVEVFVYDANHGFNCDQRGSYNEAAATLARARTLAFFASHLG